jgi:integrase
MTGLQASCAAGSCFILYTGHRDSDIVWLDFADIDDGGFSVRQRKTGRDVWRPIVPELAAEIVTWEKKPGPFPLQTNGKPYSRKLFRTF